MVRVIVSIIFMVKKYIHGVSVITLTVENYIIILHLQWVLHLWLIITFMGHTPPTGYMYNSAINNVDEMYPCFQSKHSFDFNHVQNVEQNVSLYIQTKHALYWNHVPNYTFNLFQMIEDEFDEVRITVHWQKVKSSDSIMCYHILLQRWMLNP